MNRFRSLLIITLFIFISPPLSTVSQVTDQANLQLTSSSTIIADAVEHIAGETASVAVLMGLGTDPHDYEPSPADIIAINNSDYIFWMGEGVEESLEDVLHFWEENDKSMALIDAIPSNDLIITNDNGEHGEYNPHFWLDPLLWSRSVSAITRALIDLNPSAEGVYKQNNQTYQSQLYDLHDDLLARSSELEVSQRFLITPHDSFPYFAKRYDFDATSLQGLSTDSQAGIKEIDDMASFLKENNIEVIFTESTTPPDSLEAVIDASLALGHSVVIGGQLSAGSLTSDLQSYTDLMNHNMNTIVDAILDPPEGDSAFLNNYWFFPILIVLVILRRKY